MTDQSILYVLLLVAATLWLGLKHAIAIHRMQRQLRIARSGLACQGRVVAIQRPFMLDSCTRLYFDFLPPGADEPLRVCHIAHDVDDAASALPIPGSSVIVRYLPNAPREAVIGRLVSSTFNSTY